MDNGKVSRIIYEIDDVISFIKDLAIDEKLKNTVQNILVSKVKKNEVPGKVCYSQFDDKVCIFKDTEGDILDLIITTFNITFDKTHSVTLKMEDILAYFNYVDCKEKRELVRGMIKKLFDYDVIYLSKSSYTIEHVFDKIHYTVSGEDEYLTVYFSESNIYF